MTTAHPHARGDDFSARTLSTGTVGSPPRAWGRRSSPNSWKMPSPGSPPRAWGRRSIEQVSIKGRGGSPPRAWGRLESPVRPVPRSAAHPHARGDDPVSAGRLNDDVRLTPTRVGTTQTTPLSASSTLGSPPRAWGRRARAGYNPKTSPAHPHARGDDADGLVGLVCGGRLTPTRVGTTTSPEPGTVITHGSPPRAWGRRLDVRQRSLERRLTPTRVGTTTPVMTSQYGVSGSPPRAWGRRSWSVRCAVVAAAHPHARGDDAMRMRV